MNYAFQCEQILTVYTAETAVKQLLDEVTCLRLLFRCCSRGRSCSCASSREKIHRLFQGSLRVCVTVLLVLLCRGLYMGRVLSCPRAAVLWATCQCSCGAAGSGITAPATAIAALLTGFLWEAVVAGMPGLLLSTVLLVLLKHLGV